MVGVAAANPSIETTAPALLITSNWKSAIRTSPKIQPTACSYRDSLEYS